MCRIKRLYGSITASLGAGLLLGLLISSPFFQLLLGVFLVTVGVILFVR